MPLRPNTARSPQAPLLWSLTALTLLAGAAFAWWRWQGQVRSTPHYLQLPDGTEAFFRGDTRIDPAPGYPHPRQIHVDGEVFLRITPVSEPLILRSRLLVLTVTGRTALRLTAYSKEAGEQVEVLEGHVVAHKNYSSTYTEPDVLDAGGMSMINRDIDLMEKETTNVAQLRAWSEALIAEAQKRRAASR